MTNKDKFQIPEDFYKSLFNNSSDGILMADLETKKFHLANKTICRMLNYSQKELMSLGVKDIHRQADLPCVMQQFERFAKGKAGENIFVKGVTVKRKNGSILYADVSVFPIKLFDRKYLMGSFRDITSRRQIEQDLENAETAVRNVAEDLKVEKDALLVARAKHEALLGNIGEGIIAVDQDGKIILINRASEWMLGWNSEIIGRLFVEVLNMSDEKGNLIPDTKRPITLALKGYTTTTTTTDSAYYYYKKNGHKFLVAVNVNPVKVKNKIIGAIAIFRDITKEKEMERLRTDFLVLASHQLRTPLSGVKWLIETLERGIFGPMNQKQTSYINQIYELNERMIKLVSEMLSVLHLQGESEPIEKKNVLISELFEFICQSAAAAVESEDIVLIDNLKNRQLSVCADFGILKNILECFVSNAINYSQRGQKIILKAKEESGEIIISVKDSGLGIPIDEQGKIFERFYRASNAKKYKPNGTGLGLNIAKTFAGKIGAKVWFDSKENSGSIFNISLPKNK